MPEATEEQMYRFTVEIVFDLWNRLVYQSKKTDRLQAELDEVKADRDFIRKACEDRDKLATELAALKAENGRPLERLRKACETKDDEPAGKLYAAWSCFWAVWKNNQDIDMGLRDRVENWIGDEVDDLRKAIEAAPTQPVTDAVRVAYYRLKEEWKITAALLIDGDADRRELVSGINDKLSQLGDAIREARLGKAIESAPPAPDLTKLREAWVPLDQLIRGSQFEDHGSLLTSCGAFIRFKAAIESLLGPAKDST